MEVKACAAAAPANPRDCLYKGSYQSCLRYAESSFTKQAATFQRCLWKLEKRKS